MSKIRKKGGAEDLSATWLKALVDSALDGIVTMDGAGRILAFNPSAEGIFGYRADQVVGHLVSEKLIPHALRERHDRGVAHYISTGDERIIGQRVDTVALRADGSTFPIEMEVVAVSGETAPVFMAYIRDISERRQHAQDLKTLLLEIILAVARMVEIRDPYTAGHQVRVAHLAAAIAQRLGLTESQIEGVFFGGLMHDVGKIAVPVEILARPGRLMEEDVEYIHIHCHKGYEILEPISFPWPVADIALHHHEHLDGSGYPQGLRGDAIGLEARIVAVADVVEALTAHRPYRPAHPLKEALDAIESHAGTWYDPAVVTACVELFKEGYSIDARGQKAEDWLAGRFEQKESPAE